MEPTMPAIKLYNFPRSGHAHRVELMLSLLNLPTELIFVDLPKGEHKQPEFLALNSFGQVPVIEDDGVVLADSNAILVYLAQKYGHGRWLPTDPVGAAKVQRWLAATDNQRCTLAAPTGSVGNQRPWPYFCARYTRMAFESARTTPSSSITGTWPKELSARNSGCLCSPLGRSTKINSVGRFSRDSISSTR